LYEQTVFLYSILCNAREINKKWGQTRFLFGFVDQIVALSRWTGANRGAKVIFRGGDHVGAQDGQGGRHGV
jgi:hypothetical protein